MSLESFKSFLRSRKGASVRGVIMGVILVVIGVTQIETIWDSVYTDAAGAGVNGTAWTLTKLVPMIYVGAVIIGGILLSVASA